MTEVKAPSSVGMLNIDPENDIQNPELEVHKILGQEGVMLIPRPSDDPRDPLVS
jgi:hypothetical protein